MKCATCETEIVAVAAGLLDEHKCDVAGTFPWTYSYLLADKVKADPPFCEDFERGHLANMEQEIVLRGWIRTSPIERDDNIRHMFDKSSLVRLTCTVGNPEHHDTIGQRGKS